MTNITNYVLVKNHEEAVGLGINDTFYVHTDLPGYTVSTYGLFLDSAEAVLHNANEVGADISFMISSAGSTSFPITLVGYDSGVTGLGSYGHGRMQGHFTSETLTVHPTTEEESYSYIQTAEITSVDYLLAITGLHEGVVAKTDPDTLVDFEDYVKSENGRRALEILDALDHNNSNRDPNELVDNLRAQYAKHVNPPEESSDLIIGSVGTVITWDGVAMGLPLPDNLHPMDGSSITNARSKLLGKRVNDLRGRVIAGSSPTEPAKVRGIEAGLESVSLTTDHLPLGYFPVTVGSVRAAGNVTVENLSSTVNAGNSGNFASSDKVPYSVTDWTYEGGSGIAGSGYRYPFIRSGSIGDRYLQHGHPVNISHGHPASFSGSMSDVSQQFVKINLKTAQGKLSVLQPTTYLPMYMIIY